MRKETIRKNRIIKPGSFFLAYFIIITVVFLWNLFHCTEYSWITSDLFVTDAIDSGNIAEGADGKTGIELKDEAPLIMQSSAEEDAESISKRIGKKPRLRGVALLGYENAHALKYTDESISVRVFNKTTGEAVGSGALLLKNQTPYPNDETAVYIALTEPVTQLQPGELEIRFDTFGLTRNGIYTFGGGGKEENAIPFGRLYYEKKRWTPLMPVLYFVLEIFAGLGCMLLYGERKMPLFPGRRNEHTGAPETLLSSAGSKGYPFSGKLSLRQLALPAVLLILVVVMMTYTYVHAIKKAAGRCDADLLTGGESGEVIALEPGMTLRQNFTAGENDLSGIGIMLAEKDKKSVESSKKTSYAETLLEWKLLDETGTAALTSGSAQVKELKKVRSVLGKDIQDENVLTAADDSYVLPLDDSIREAEGKQFMLEISMPDQDDSQQPVYLLATGETNGQIYTEGANAGESADASSMQQGTLPLELGLMGTYSCNGFIKGMYLRVCAFLLITLAGLYYAARWIGGREKDSSRQAAAMYLVSALCMGMVFSFLTPAYTISDERTHIDSVYAVSNSLLGIRDLPGPRRLLKRACDIDSTIANTMPVTAKRYRVVQKGLFKGAPRSLTRGQGDQDSVSAGGEEIYIPTGRELTPAFNREATSNVPILCYLPSAIGFSAARLLGRNMITMVMAARWLNLLACIGIMYLAIRRMPYGAAAMAVIGLFPKMLQLMSSCSYDGMICAGTFFFISLSLAVAFEEKVSITDLLMLFLTGLYVAACKGGAYLPVLGITLLIPSARAGKGIKRRSRWTAVSAAVLGGAAILFLGKYLVRLFGILGRDSGTATIAAGTKTLYTFSDFIHAPAKLLRIYINTILMRGDGLLGEMVGKNLCQRWYFVYGFFILALLGILRRNKPRQGENSSQDHNHLRLWGRLWVLFLAAVSCSLVFLSMLLAFTQKGAAYIDGLQGRYLLPIALLPFLAVENGLVHRDGIGDTAILYTADYILAITACEIFMTYLGGTL